MTYRATTISDALPSFNGATTDESWMTRDSRARCRGIELLQWGHDW